MEKFLFDDTSVENGCHPFWHCVQQSTQCHVEGLHHVFVKYSFNIVSWTDVCVSLQGGCVGLVQLQRRLLQDPPLKAEKPHCQGDGPSSCRLNSLSAAHFNPKRNRIFLNIDRFIPFTFGKSEPPKGKKKELYLLC